MIVHSFVAVFVIYRAENKDSAFSVPDGMVRNFSFTGFKSFIGKVVKTKSTGIERGSLLSIANPEGDVVYIRELMYQIYKFDRT